VFPPSSSGLERSDWKLIYKFLKEHKLLWGRDEYDKLASKPLFKYKNDVEDPENGKGAFTRVLSHIKQQ